MDRRRARARREPMTDLQLSKLHATGNDFLVQLSLDPDEAELDAVVVSALCDRHRGRDCAGHTRVQRLR